MGTGVLTLSNGGAFTASGGTPLTIANLGGSQGTLNIGADAGSAAAAPGTVTASSVAFGAGTGSIVFNHTSDAYTFASSIAGTGTVNARAGTTNLTGDMSGFMGDFSLTGGTLNFAHAGSQTLSSSFTGNGGLGVTVGTTNLTGDMSGFTGAFSLTGGTLNFAHAGSQTLSSSFTGNGGLGVTAGATTLTANNAGFAGSVAVDGGGTLNVQEALGGSSATVGNGGVGVMTVSGDGAVATVGALTIAGQAGSQGTLNIGADAGSAAAAPGTVTASSVAFGAGTGSIVFNHTSDAYTFASPITGAGTLNARAGTTNLTGDLSGFTGTFSLTGGVFNYAHALDVTVSATLSGNGDMDFTQGKTILTGDSSGFTGTTEVGGAGTLSVNGSLGGDVNVESGGRLQGTGTVEMLHANAGGTVAPGNSIGTLDVSGDVTFNPGSTYEVEVNTAGSSDLIHATGQAFLNGGTVNMIPLAGSSYLVGHPYTILTADGGIVGAFDAITVNQTSLFLSGQLTYDANSVRATLARGSFSSVAATPNQQAAAATLNEMTTGNDVYDALLTQTDAGQVRSFYDDLSGQVHADIKNALYEQQRDFSDTVLARMDGPQPMAETAAWETQAPGASIWGEGLGRRMSFEGDGNARTFTSTEEGAMFGMNGAARGDPWRLGVAFGYAASDFRVRDGGSGIGKSYMGSLHAGRKIGDLALRFGFGAGWSDIETDRSVGLVGYTDRLKAAYAAQTVNGFSEAGYAIHGAATRVEPFARLTGFYETREAFSENGGDAALNVKGDDLTLGGSMLGIRLQHLVPLADEARFDGLARIKGMIGWRHLIGAKEREDENSFAGQTTTFSVKGAPMARDALALNAGIDFKASDGVSLGFLYSADLSSHTANQSVNGTLTIQF